MSNLDLQQVSPSRQTSKVMSTRYQTLSSVDLVNAILSILNPDTGEQIFEIRSIQTTKTRAGREGRGKHIVRLQTVKAYSLDGDMLHPEIVIINSYDGTSLLQVEMGLFRCVCMNGLILKSKDLGQIKIRHMGTPSEVAFGIVKEFVNNTTQFVKVTKRLTETILTDDQIFEFGAEAAMIRWEEKEVSVEDVELLLEPTRVEDEGNSVWKVLNRIQEKIEGGGIKLTNAKRVAKAIRNIGEKVRMNTELFELADRYCKQYAEYEMVA